jgi:Zn finger protein HypA/HybF involved in hydrogenase expression
MTASIQEMSSTNTQQLRISSRRARRSWQRRGLAVLVVSTYLLQCATAHEADLRRLLTKTQGSDPDRRRLQKMTAIDKGFTDIKLGFASTMEDEYKQCIKDELIGTYVHTSDTPITYTINDKRCTECKQRVEVNDYCRNCYNQPGLDIASRRIVRLRSLEDAPKAYIQLIRWNEQYYDGDWGIFDSDDVLHFWCTNKSKNSDRPPTTGWSANDYPRGDDNSFHKPSSRFDVSKNEQVAEFIKLTGVHTYEVAKERKIKCRDCKGSGTNWTGYFDCSDCNGDGWSHKAIPTSSDSIYDSGY